MPINFSIIPAHLKMSIAQKQDHDDFVRFSETSRKSFDTASKVRTRFSAVFKKEATLKCTEKGIFFFNYDDYVSSGNIYEQNLAQSPVSVTFSDVIINDLDETSCEWITKVFSFTGSCIVSLKLDGISCSPEQLNDLLQTTNVAQLQCWNGISSHFLKLAAVRKLTSLCAWALSDNDFLEVKSKCINVGRTIISTAAINKVLKEWHRGERDIERIVLSIAPRSRIESIVEGLNYRPSGSKKSKFIRYYLENENQVSLCVVFIKATSVLTIGI